MDCEHIPYMSEPHWSSCDPNEVGIRLVQRYTFIICCTFKAFNSWFNSVFCALKLCHFYTISFYMTQNWFMTINTRVHTSSKKLSGTCSLEVNAFGNHTCRHGTVLNTETNSAMFFTLHATIHVFIETRPWEANSHSHSQGIPNLLWNSKGSRFITVLIKPCLSHTNAVHIIQPYLKSFFILFFYHHPIRSGFLAQPILLNLITRAIYESKHKS
jgi:hypothetical protein